MNLTNGERCVKVFPSNLFPVNTFSMKAIINLSKFCSSKFLTCSIHQISSDFSTIKVLHYTVTIIFLAIASYMDIHT